MSNIAGRLLKIRQDLRRKERQEYFDCVRQQILKKAEQKQFQSEAEEVFIMAEQLINSQGQPVNLLNIYVNIQYHLRQFLWMDSPNSFVEKLAFWLYLQLTSSQQVMTFICQQSQEREWDIMFILLNKHPLCSEYLYQRMKSFLSTLCKKEKLDSYHIFDIEDLGILRNILTVATTQKMLGFDIESDEDSEYYDLMSTYLSIVPKSQLIPIINEGYFQLIARQKNKKVVYTMLARMQILGEYDPIMKEYFDCLAQQFRTIQQSEQTIDDEEQEML